MTAEQKARDMLQRIGVPDAQSYTAGDLVELANLIADSERWERDHEPCSCGHERQTHHAWGKCHGLRCKCTGFVGVN